MESDNDFRKIKKSNKDGEYHFKDLFYLEQK